MGFLVRRRTIGSLDSRSGPQTARICDCMSWNRVADYYLVADLAQDLRNHGDSDHNPRHDYTALAQDVEGFIDDHKLGEVTLIGHSMGAKTAMTVALRSPHLVKNLVSVDNAPVDATLGSDFAKYARGMQKIEESQVRKRSEADEILEDFEESLPIRQFLLTNLVLSLKESPVYRFRIPLRILASALENMADFPFKDPDTARYEKPALFLRGTRSRYVSDEVIPLIGRFFPRFTLKDIEAGHWLISENPDAFRTG
ncbi:hypothetical protein GP486_002326 [Trichoglossum hirsutum]|uniref:AB hydrolase-1 domain-containing protein n=1 Tax=Trichoglossum hirsutum TaxID=265104 RepID=A0A9P8RS70_9PEZI|nr:hypothetical protein GP486_002326 [Trichoglossum hirsutum]